MTLRTSASILVLAILAVFSKLSAAASVAPVIDAGAAAALITGGGDVVVLDARAPVDVAHVRIRGSRHAGYGDWLRRNRRDLDDPQQLERWRLELADLGIGEETVVVIHDVRSSYNAPATVWYALQAIGLGRVTVVNGGFEALVDRLPPGWLDWTPASHGPDTPAPPRPDAATPRRQPVHAPHAIKDDVLAVLATGGQQLVDTRRADEFAGLGDIRNPRPGHIPGALNIPHDEFRDESGLIRAPAEILALLAEHGLDPAAPLLVYCQGGGRSAFAALALVHAGCGTVRNYAGSFGEWSRDEGCPVETGAVRAEH